MNKKIVSMLVIIAFIITVMPIYVSASSTPTFEPTKKVYYPNEKLIVSGSGWTSGYYVSFDIKNPNGNLVWHEDLLASSDGTINGSILTFPSKIGYVDAAGNKWPAGNYTILATDGYTSETATRYVTFTQAGAVNGTVKDSLGAAVEGATVTLDGKTTTTDVNGIFSFTDIGPGSYTLNVSKSGFKSYSASIEVKAGETTEVSVTLEYLKGTVAGVVKDQTGLPIEGAAVTLDSSSASTDASGKFTFTDVEAGNYTLTVSKAGYSTNTTIFTLAAGESKSFTIILSSKVLSFEKIVLPSITGVDTPTKIKVEVQSGLGGESNVALTASVTLPNNTVTTTLVTFTESSTAGLYYGEFTPTVAGTYYMTLKAEKAGYTNASSDEYVVQVLAKTDISPLMKKMDDLSTQLTDTGSKILTSVSALSTQLANMQDSINGLKDSVGSVLSSLTSIQSTLSTLSSDLSSLSGKVDSVASAVSSGFSSVKSSMSGLATKSDVGQVSSGMDKLSGSVTTALGSLSSLITATAVLVIITLIIAAVATFKVFKS